MSREQQYKQLADDLFRCASEEANVQTQGAMGNSRRKIFGDFKAIWGSWRPGISRRSSSKRVIERHLTGGCLLFKDRFVAKCAKGVGTEFVRIAFTLLGESDNPLNDNFGHNVGLTCIM